MLNFYYSNLYLERILLLNTFELQYDTLLYMYNSFNNRLFYHYYYSTSIYVFLTFKKKRP
jgi:hypothetical protein